MSETSQPPSNEEIQDLLNDAQQLLGNLINYRQEASRIDAKVENSTDDYVPLDNLPYGEELIRTKALPEEVKKTIQILEDISDGYVQPNEITSLFQKAEETIEEARGTLEDCTPLPEDEDEDEDEGE